MQTLSVAESAEPPRLEPRRDGFSGDVLDEVLRTGPFHTALRLTIHARGLTLERLREHLARRGHRVSISTLSNWQRGSSRPDHTRSRKTLAALEELLGVPANGLSDLLGPRRRPAQRPNAVPGMQRTDAERLRAELGVPPPTPTALLTVREQLMIGPSDADWREDNHLVVEALRSGVDRHIVLYHAVDDLHVEISAGGTCTLGRVRREVKSGLIAAELLFDRPLTRGETYPLEYHMRCTDSEPRRYTGRWFRGAGMSYDLAVRFETDPPPAGAERIWRLDPAIPHKSVGELRLINGTVAHFADTELEPGFHGIRWTWPDGR